MTTNELVLLTELHSKGLNDTEISKEMSKAQSTIHFNRSKVLKLLSHQPERTYGSDEDRMKGYMIRQLKFSAKRRGIDFKLVPSDIILVDTCPLLNIELEYLDLSIKTNDFNSINRATVDRIDNSKGYIASNIWIISRLANNMKSSASTNQLETFCNNVLKKMI